MSSRATVQTPISRLLKREDIEGKIPALLLSPVAQRRGPYRPLPTNPMRDEGLDDKARDLLNILYAKEDRIRIVLENRFELDTTTDSYFLMFRILDPCSSPGSAMDRESVWVGPWVSSKEYEHEDLTSKHPRLAQPGGRNYLISERTTALEKLSIHIAKSDGDSKDVQLSWLSWQYFTWAAFSIKAAYTKAYSDAKGTTEFILDGKKFILDSEGKRQVENTLYRLRQVAVLFSPDNAEHQPAFLDPDDPIQLSEKAEKRFARWVKVGDKKAREEAELDPIETDNESDDNEL